MYSSPSSDVLLQEFWIIYVPLKQSVSNLKQQRKRHILTDIVTLMHHFCDLSFAVVQQNT